MSAETDPIVLNLDDPYYVGQSLPDALAEFSHVHSATGICVKNTYGPRCRAAVGVNLFDVIKAKAWEIAEFHAQTNGVAYTEDERVAIDVGLSCGVHAAIEHYAPPAEPHRPVGSPGG